MSRELTSYEKETIINFNKADDVAYIFTYEKSWQKHLEGKLDLKPVMDNGFGGKEYELPKSRIKPPKAPVKLSAERRAQLALQAKHMINTRNLGKESPVTIGKSDTRKKE